MNFYFPYMGNVIMPTDENHIVSEGWLNRQLGKIPWPGRRAGFGFSPGNPWRLVHDGRHQSWLGNPRRKWRFSWENHRENRGNTTRNGGLNGKIIYQLSIAMFHYKRVSIGLAMIAMVG